MKTLVYYNKKENAFQFSNYRKYSINELILKNPSMDAIQGNSCTPKSTLLKEYKGVPVPKEVLKNVEIDTNEIYRLSISTDIGKKLSRQEFVLSNIDKAFFVNDNGLYINTEIETNWGAVLAELQKLDTDNLVILGIMNERYFDKKTTPSEMGSSSDWGKIRYNLWDCTFVASIEIRLLEKIYAKYRHSFETICNVETTSYAGFNQWNQWSGDDTVYVYNRFGKKYKCAKTAEYYDLDNLVGENFQKFVKKDNKILQPKETVTFKPPRN